MSQRLRLSRPRHATVVAYLALLIALGGTAYAANTVGSADVIDESLTGADIKGKHATSSTAGVNGALTGADISGQAAKPSVGQPFVDGSLTTSDIRDATVSASDLADGAVTPAKVGTTPAVQVSNTTDQSVPHDTPTDIKFNYEAFDTAGLHAGSGHVLTAPIRGIYLLSANVLWDSNATGWRQLEIRGGGVSNVTDASSSPFGMSQSASGLVELGAGSELYLELRQTSGGPLNLVSRTDLAMVWVGPAPPPPPD